LNKRDLQRFKKLLLEQRDQIQGNAKKTLSGDIHVDPEFAGRLREREHGLLAKIDAALVKIEEGEYGECKNCGEPIGVARLRARPVAELCIECKSEQEKLERRTG
jgi:DnaK suppressor protein